VIRQPKQDRKNPDVNIDQVAYSLAQEWAGMTRELLAPLEQNEVERFLGAEILVDQLLDLAQELSVLEDRQLDVEYRRLLGTGMLLRRARTCFNLSLACASAAWKRLTSASIASSGMMR